MSVREPHALGRAMLVAFLAGVLGGCGKRSEPAPPSSSASSPLVIDGGDSVVTAHGETFHARLLAFDLSTSALEVRDVGMHPVMPSLDDPTIRAASNGAYFDSDGRARGLVVSRGVELSAFDPTMSGGVLTLDAGRAALFESESFDRSAKHGFAIQSKPRLVVSGRVNIRSDDGQRAARTVVCLRNEGRELVLGTMTSDTGGPSLLAAADALQSAGCEDALNLDGGPSTALAWRDQTGSHVSLPHGPLRHALVVLDP